MWGIQGFSLGIRGKEGTYGLYSVLVWEPEGKRPLGRHQHRLDDNIKWVFRKWDGEGHELD